MYRYGRSMQSIVDRFAIGIALISATIADGLAAMWDDF